MQQNDKQLQAKANRIARPAVRIALLATMAFGTIVVGCAESTPSPLAPETESPRFATTVVASSTVNVNVFLEQEKNRITLEGERSKVTQDRLKLDR